jgi:hypothetical protein
MDVTRKSDKRRIVQLFDGEAEPPAPVDQVLRRSDVSASNLDRVAGLHQVPSEPLDQFTPRSISQCLKAPPAAEQL